VDNSNSEHNGVGRVDGIYIRFRIPGRINLYVPECAMISFELARRLKQAGFPQSELARRQCDAGYDYVSMPGLAALIEACGRDFGALGRKGGGWVACGYVAQYGEWKNAHSGHSPEDAVARLWLAVYAEAAAEDAVA
jgi:hypothetical protein